MLSLIFALITSSPAHAYTIRCELKDQRIRQERLDVFVDLNYSWMGWGSLQGGKYSYILGERIATGPITCRKNDRNVICAPTNGDDKMRAIVVLPMAVFADFGNAPLPFMDCAK